MEGNYLSAKISSVGVAEGEGYTTSELAIMSSEKCFKNLEKFNENSVEAILLSTGLPDNFGTSTSTLIKKAFKIANCACHDLTAGDTGFLYALQLGASYIESEKYSTVLVVAAETPTVIVEEDSATTKRNRNVAGAILLQRTDTQTGFHEFALTTNYEAEEILKYPVGGSRYPISFNAVMRNECKVKMNYQLMDRKAIANIAESIRKKSKYFSSEFNTKIIFPTYFKEELIKQIMKESGVSDSYVFSSIERGYSGSASIAITLKKFFDSCEYKTTNYLLAVAGANMTYGTVIYKIS